jgi:hypothetical protein
MVRLGRFVEAARLVGESCDDPSWSCDLLMGLVLHRSGQAVRAEPLFRQGMKMAPEPLACRLESIEPLLLDADLSHYRGLACDDRDEFHLRLWWLADPFFSRPGNERWTEHSARRLETGITNTRAGHGSQPSGNFNDKWWFESLNQNKFLLKSGVKG